MVRKFWNNLAPHSRTHLIVATIGAIVGALFGDQLFIVVEHAIGSPWDDLVLAIGGAMLASVVYEGVTILRRTS